MTLTKDNDFEAEVRFNKRRGIISRKRLYPVEQEEEVDWSDDWTSPFSDDEDYNVQIAIVDSKRKYLRLLSNMKLTLSILEDDKIRIASKRQCMEKIDAMHALLS
jgi:hypothetical protein